MSFRFLLVDDDWAKVGLYDDDEEDWSVGQEIVDDQGRRFAITGIVENLDPSSDVTSTWMVEPA